MALIARNHAAVRPGTQFGRFIRSGFSSIRSRSLARIDEELGRASQVTIIEGNASPNPISGVAISQGDIARAKQLVKKRYTRVGYRVIEDQGMRFLTHGVTPVWFPIVSTVQGRVVGTVTLVVDSEKGLSLDENNRDTADAVRSEGGRICELVRLAIDDNVDSTAVLCSMFETVYEICVGKFNCTDLLIEVIPRHALYYQEVFGFTQVSGLRRCERVGGVTSIVMRLRRRDFESHLARGPHGVIRR